MNAIASSSSPVQRALKPVTSRPVTIIHLSLLATAIALSGCDRADFGAPAAPPAPAASTVSPDVSWAGTALARNPNLEVLATDATAAVFTVRIKATGQVKTVRASELAASPITDLAPPAQMAMRSETPETMTPAVPLGGASIAQTPYQAPSQTPPTPPKEGSATIRRADGGGIVASLGTPAPTQTDSQTASTQSSDGTQGYTIERQGGQLKVSGPGVSIVSSGRPAASTRSTDERNTGPVICDGSRMLHLDNRVISASGTGVIARGGCELYITNSRITASGTGVVVGDAIVHIANSTIEGSLASFEADDRARMFVRSSTFKGVTRRADQAVIQDQGGNQWH